MATERSLASTTLSSREQVDSGRIRSARLGLCRSMLNGSSTPPKTFTTWSTTAWLSAGTSDFPVTGAMRGMMGSFLRDGAGGAIPLTSVGIIEHPDTLGEDDMDARDLFLDQHAVMHSAAVGSNKMSAAERTFAGLTDEQMRVRPREDLNSLAWLMWHIARAEDILVNAVLAAQPQVFDDAWKKRLGGTRPDFGIGITSAEVTPPTRQVDPRALRADRDAV